MIAIFAIPFFALAQFADQTQPIYYIYDYTDTDGVRSIDDEWDDHFGTGFIVMFKKGIAAIEWSSVTEITKNLTPEVKNRVAQRLSKDIQFMSRTQPADGAYFRLCI